MMMKKRSKKEKDDKDDEEESPKMLGQWFLRSGIFQNQIRYCAFFTEVALQKQAALFNIPPKGRSSSVVVARFKCLKVE